MSVLCCHIPDFLLRLTYRRQPELADKPFALQGVDESLSAVSSIARQRGVQVGMMPRQAQMRCPELALYPLNEESSLAEQQALMESAAEWLLPVEESGWGQAYVDLHTLTCNPATACQLATDLGQRVRRMLGPELQPALGWDSGKFTARAAANTTAPGHIRLVAKKDEVRFLNRLPITLLPLHPKMIQQLAWMGLTTLGQFARLPRTSVWQRFGKAGAEAQRWAQGCDDRPVCNSIRPSTAHQAIEMDPPTAFLPTVLEMLLAACRPHLFHLADRLTGLRRLHLQLIFINGDVRDLDLRWMEPISQERRLSHALRQQLQQLNWPDELSRIKLLRMEAGELTPQQMLLFPELETQNKSLQTSLARLIRYYGPIFHQGRLCSPLHPVAERRFTYSSL